MSEKLPMGRGWTPGAIVGVYLLFGFLWILLSDWLVDHLFSDRAMHQIVQTYKGSFYVLMTGLVLFALIRSSVKRTEKIEAARVASRDRYDQLVENANDAIFTLDVDGNFTAVNRAVSAITGYSEKELLGMKFEQILADDQSDYITQLLDPQTTQNPSSVREVKIRCKDGRFGFLEVSSRPLSVLDDRASIENIARDITLRHLMQAELENAKERYQRLIETANEGIWTVDEAFRVTLVNPKMCEITGLSQSFVLGRTISEIFGDELVKRCEGDFAKPTVDARSSFDLQFTRPDGGKIWLLITTNPLVQNGEFQGLLFMATDITERKRTEMLHRESEERFRVLFERSPIGGMIMSRDDRIIDCNPAAAEMLGYTRAELRAMTVKDFDAKLGDSELDGIRQEAFSTNRQFQFETLHKTKSGKIRNVLVAATNLSIKGELYSFAAFLDITERKNAIEALRASEERLRKLYRIVSNSELGSCGRIGQLLELGTREFGVETGLLLEKVGDSYEAKSIYSPENRISKNQTIPASLTIYDAVPDAEEPIAIENIGQSDFRDHPAYKHFGVESYIGVTVQVSGERYGALCFTARVPRRKPFTSGDREFLKLMAQWTGAELTRDKAEQALRTSEEQLLQAQKLESVGRLAGGIAHDFNNMLTAINGYSDLIMSKMSDDDPLRHNISEIKKAGERSAALTQQLLAFSRKQILNPEIININQAVNDVTKLLQRLIGEDITLAENLSPEVLPVEVDPGQLSQVIVNLAVNSRDAMPGGGVLTIATETATPEQLALAGRNGGRPTPYVRLSVSDTGIGMDEETRRQLFEPFFTTKEVGKGTGLGLATVYGFIKQSDGFIHVESAPGAGTTFHIFLPCVESQADAAVHITGSNKTRAGAETILLVEDEEIVRKLGCDVLRSCGYKVIEAAGGEAAIEICERESPEIDLLLTDVVMPQMNGRELWEKLSVDHKNMKVLFTSGYTDDMVVRSGIRNEETNFLQKPFTVDSLIEKVREILDSGD